MAVATGLLENPAANGNDQTIFFSNINKVFGIEQDGANAVMLQLV